LEVWPGKICRLDRYSASLEGGGFESERMIGTACAQCLRGTANCVATGSTVVLGDRAREQPQETHTMRKTARITRATPDNSGAISKVLGLGVMLPMR